MPSPHYFLWTGGQPGGGAEDAGKTEALPLFPPPAPLQRTAQIVYHWGQTRFEIVAIACSLREAPWGDEPTTWLHCKAMTAGEVKPDEKTELMTVLIPADYITSVQAGTTYRHLSSKPVVDVGVFPPNQPAPQGPMQVEQIERILAELLSVERN